MTEPSLNDPNAQYWDELVDEFYFTPGEKKEIRAGADRMITEVRARRLADLVGFP